MDTTANTQQQARRHRAWRITRAYVILLWSVLAIFAGLLWEMFKVFMRALPENTFKVDKSSYDEPNAGGGVFNGRTGRNDDGRDPQGIYDYDR